MGNILLMQRESIINYQLIGNILLMQRFFSFFLQRKSSKGEMNLIKKDEDIGGGGYIFAFLVCNQLSILSD